MTPEAETAAKLAAIVIGAAAAAIIAVTVPAAFAGETGAGQFSTNTPAKGTSAPLRP